MTGYFLALALVLLLLFMAQRRPAIPARAGRLGPSTGSAGPALPVRAESTPEDQRARGLSLFVLAASGVLVALAALRWRRGTDYWTYAESWPGYVRTPWSEFGLTDEPGIRVLAMIGRHLADEPASMFALASLVTVGLTTWTISRSTNHLMLAFFLYVTSGAWQGSFNGVRQYLACAILFAGHSLILKRRFWPYLCVVFIASLFHLSAWIVLLLYWLPRRQLLPLQVVLLLAGALAVLNGYELIGGVFDAVKDSDVSGGSYFEERVNPLRLLLAVAPVMIYLLFTDRKRLDESGSFYANVLYLNALVMLASLNSAYVARFSIYTSVYLAVAVPALLNMGNQRLRDFLTLLVVVGFGAFWVLETSAQPVLVPYRSVFER